MIGVNQAIKKTKQHPTAEGLSAFRGTGSCLPTRIISNEELSQFADTTDEWISDRVGVKTRHIVSGSENTTTLARGAAMRALAAAEIAPSAVDLIIVATVTAAQSLPSQAALLQRELGTPSSMSFDIQAACSGFVFSLATADSLLRVQGFKTALVVGVESLSRIVNWADRRTCVLFGDGAGAVVYRLNEENGSGVLAADMHNNANQADLICRPGGAYPPATLPPELGVTQISESSPYVHMNGQEVFKSGIMTMVSSSRRVLSKGGFSIDDVDWFIPHQANKRMLEAVAEKLGVPPTKVIQNLERVGNTSAASIPIALDEAVREGKVSRGDLILMTAVGAGLSYGSLLIRW